MEYKFETGFTTNIPTCCLIEDYQGLLRAWKGLNEGTMDIEDVMGEINCVMECIADAISNYTPKTTKLSPSVASAISMNIDSGIITQPDGSDLLCAAHKPLSESMIGSVCQCSEECMRKNGCDPSMGINRMENGFLYVRSPSGADDLLDS